MGKMPPTEKQIVARRENCRKIGKLPKSPKSIEASKINVKKATRAASNPSKPELKFRDFLNEEKITFIPQYRIAKWIGDIFISSRKLVIEIDGVYWHCIRGAQLDDWFQHRELKKMGYNVILFWDYEINNNIENCMKKIKQYFDL